MKDLCKENVILEPIWFTNVWKMKNLQEIKNGTGSY